MIEVFYDDKFLRRYSKIKDQSTKTKIKKQIDKAKKKSPTFR